MVKISNVLLAAGAASVAIAAPAPVKNVKRENGGQPDIDTVILNYALTLEHLENAFYRDALPSAQAFKDADYPDWVHQRFIEIGGHERSHVMYLSNALGDKAVKECQYNFGVTGPKSFIATSQLLEGVGVSAYLGAAANITNPAYLTAAGSILTTEARHSAWVQSSAALSDAFGAAYDTPTNFNQTYSLAAPLITSCPDSNAKLPVVAFPAASFAEAPTKLGQTVTVKSDKLSSGDKLGFIGGAGAVSFAPIQNGMATLPKEVTWGRTYAIIVKGNANTITDDNTVAGPIAFDILPTAEEAADFYKRSM